MLYKYIKDYYKQAEPIFLSDLLISNISKPALIQQLRELCEKGLLQQCDVEVYFIPKKSRRLSKCRYGGKVSFHFKRG